MQPRKGPLGDVAVRTALLTRADVRVLANGRGPTPVEGIGAICRYP